MDTIWEINTFSTPLISLKRGKLLVILVFDDNAHSSSSAGWDSEQTWMKRSDEGGVGEEVELIWGNDKE